jgi:imidazole glycerol-phosphate synthase subunit HisH
MIAVVDYGRGNLHSVTSALDMIGEEVAIVSTPEELESADRIVLPGVGAFPAGMESLHKSGLVDSLNEQVRVKGKPFLGICLGMQFLANSSLEGTQTPGLGWIDATVREIPASKHGLKLPHVGWNETAPVADSVLFDRMGRNPILYYVHSYAITMDSDESSVDAHCLYGDSVVAALRFQNIAATQFHPEKSQNLGLKFLANWADWKP